jgi:hypothetical protein
MRPILLLCAGFALCLFLGHNAVSQDKVTRKVSNETLEKILQGLDLKFQRLERKEKDTAISVFEFTRSGQQCRLTNYGTDLWIECSLEKKLPLEEVNRWNADAKFSRLVLVETKDKIFVSLEAQLDCFGGVTDAVIKQYINRFDEEAKKFAKFAK